MAPIIVCFSADVRARARPGDGLLPIEMVCLLVVQPSDRSPYVIDLKDE
jgi:hypothetical protein